MAKKTHDMFKGLEEMPRDKDGFVRLIPVPGSKADHYINYRNKLPKNSDTFLYDLVGTYGTDHVMNMTEVDIGDYVYSKGITHALNMNIGRSIPWIEDGLKFGERRALYIMWTMKLYGSNTAKVSSIVGRMIEKVYPHGDQAPADIIYRLGRSRSTMIPYIKPGGNFGNMVTMKPAAPRYASASLTNYAMDCFFTEIGARAPLYDTKDNYDFSDKEPVYLVARYPNILMQWNQGIGKGAAAWLGAFNSKDILKTAITMLDDPECKVEIYPDFPIPVTITNKDSLRNCFDMKKFRVNTRAPYEVIVDQRHEGSKIVNFYTLVFNCLPLAVTGNMIREQIKRIKEEDEKRVKKRLPEVLNINVHANDDTPGGVKVIIEYEKGYDPHLLAEKLYHMTSLAKTIGVQYKLIADNKSSRFTPREIMKTWISQRYDQKRRYYHQEALQAAKDRTKYEAIATILRTSDATDKALSIIRSSNNKEVSIERLQKEFDFTEFQAKTILSMRLEHLPKLSVEELLQKREEAIKRYKHCRKILTDENAIKEAIRAELEEGLKKYGRSRCAALMNLEENDSSDSSLDKWVYYNKDQYYCTSDPNGLSEFASKMDRSYQMVKIQNQDPVIIVDNKGTIKVVNGYAFTESEQGINLAKFGVSNVVRLLPGIPSFKTDAVLLITKNGYGKLMDYDECTKSAKGRLIVFPGDSTDELVDIIPISKRDAENKLVCIASGTKVYYCRLSDFPVLKRSSIGNFITKGVKKPDLERAYVLDSNADYMMIYGESGYFKLVDINYLTFKRKISAVEFAKGINGILSISLSAKKTKFMRYDTSGRTEFMFENGKQLRVTSGDKIDQKLKLSTTIGNPTKVLKMSKNEFYHIE